MQYKDMLRFILLIISVGSMAAAQVAPDQMNNADDANTDQMFGGGRGPGGPGGGGRFGGGGPGGNPGGGFGGGGQPQPRPEPPQPRPEPPSNGGGFGGGRGGGFPGGPGGGFGGGGQPRPEPRPFPQPQPQPRPEPPGGGFGGGGHGPGGGFPGGPRPGFPGGPGGPGGGGPRPQPPIFRPEPPRPIPPPFRPEPPRPFPRPLPPPVFVPAPQPPPVFVPPPQPPQPVQLSDTKVISIGRSVQNESLSLRQLSDIGPEYRGWQVVALTANTRPNSQARTVVNLTSNGVLMATQTNPGSQISLVPQRRLTLGEAVDSLALSVTGSTIIDSITMQLRYDERQVVTIEVNRSVNNNEVIDLTQYADLRSQMGRSIDQILVTASSPSGGSILIAVNNTNLGQPQLTTGLLEEKSVLVDKEQILGSAAYSTSLYTYGDVTIGHVTIILK
jgi:hypothetical protein